MMTPGMVRTVHNWWWDSDGNLWGKEILGNNVVSLHEERLVTKELIKYLPTEFNEHWIVKTWAYIYQLPKDKEKK